MSENQIINSILELISKSQFSTEIKLIDDYSLIYEEAKEQSILGLIAQEIPKDIADSNPDWNKAIYTQITNYIKYNYAEEQLIKVMKNASVPLVILKGNAAAINYKEPTRRSMGDIDFLVPQDLFDKTCNVLKNAGYVELSSNDRHIVFKKDAMIFELHHHYSATIDIEDYLIEGFKDIQIGKIDDHEFPMLPKLANGLVLLDHMGRHLKSGLGLRQVIDWMMYVYHELDDEFWEKEFSRVAKEKGLDTLAIVTTRMCQIYLGLPETIKWCKDADEKVCEQLMENLLASGNFGRKQGKGSSVETVSTSIKRKGLFRWLQYAGEYNWEAYHKHHWLKPFCWFYQIFRYAKQGFKSGRSREELSGDLNRSEQRYELLKKLGIE